MDLTPQAILDTISEEAALDPARLVPEATIESLEIASLDMVSIFFVIEDKFGVEIQPEDAATSSTLQDLVNLIMRKAAEAR